MSSKTPRLDDAFIQKQSRRLTKLREELLEAMRTEQSEENALHSQSVGEAQEFEDDAQKLAMLELQGTLADRTRQRLARVERALQKIVDGTYGLSDASGEPISRARLEAMPDAIFTLSERQTRDIADERRATDNRKT